MEQLRPIGLIATVTKMLHHIGYLKHQCTTTTRTPKGPISLWKYYWYDWPIEIQSYFKNLQKHTAVQTKSKIEMHQSEAYITIALGYLKTKA